MSHFLATLLGATSHFTFLRPLPSLPHIVIKLVILPLPPAISPRKQKHKNFHIHQPTFICAHMLAFLLFLGQTAHTPRGEALLMLQAPYPSSTQECLVVLASISFPLSTKSLPLA
jgi:hypothetical protein